MSLNFLSEGKRLIKVDEKYEDIYTTLTEKTGLAIHEIFYLCTLLGFKSQQKSEEFIGGRKEFRVSYLEETQRSVLYAIANETIKLSELTTSDAINSVIKEYQRYSNGGMEILIENVLNNHYKDGRLQENYTKYDIDILKYIYDQLIAIPF
ncbi:hypothetical protein [Tetragenococcus halophilus]|uniref:hypothetical protein n=1 Tax=Tetragenococcus halophilus TaxID=51669 RepID=UPI000CCB5C04|nr:hypothetical protein [Tetragenococcus halophilus]GBD61698.1 hypothetical protein TEH11_1381 [Tetragenococcus halophilus subsp. halophilus]GMG62153.1 hypothetical protein TEHAB4_19000 [Tetragenococcus halophilus]GMG69736.1 hypothetical protein TEHOK1_04250 [Tetragenococcus halophilus]